VGRYCGALLRGVIAGGNSGALLRAFKRGVIAGRNSGALLRALLRGVIARRVDLSSGSFIYGMLERKLLFN
jgi:hypothetical protein